MDSTESNECIVERSTDRTVNSVVSNTNLIAESASNNEISGMVVSNASSSLVDKSEVSEKFEDIKNAIDDIEKENNRNNPTNSEERAESQNAHINVQESTSSGKCKSKHSSPRKHRAKHCKKRKWKPYMKLTCSERRKLEERDARRASRIREEMSSSGLALAPYNTTQFIMEDHELQEPIYDKNVGPMVDSIPEEESFDSPSDESAYFQKQFKEAYDSIDDDYVNEESKYSLVCQLMRMEDEIEQLEKALEEAKKEKMNRSEDDVEADLQKIRVFQEEIEKMTQENALLSGANYRLYSQLQRMS